MSRPLIISDCDEVLLHMVAPYKEWLAERHGIDFAMQSNDFGKAMRYADGGYVEPAEIWRLLNLFFDTEMYRQQPIAGAVDGVNALAEHADVVILTNLAITGARIARGSCAMWASMRGSSPTPGPRGRRSRRFSTNTARNARCSSTICRSTMDRSPNWRRMSRGCTCAESRCWPPYRLRASAGARARPDRRMVRRAALADGANSWSE
jgi:hypothetical protein